MTGKRNGLFNFITVCLLTCTGLCACSRGSLTEEIPAGQQRNNKAEGFLDVNKDDPGQEVNVQSDIVFGKYTVIEFTSPGCGACQSMRPLMEKLHEFRPDIVVRSYDVNRKNAGGIDWESPLAQKYKIHSLPAFKIYNSKGVLIADGDNAREQVRKVVEHDEMN